MVKVFCNKRGSGKSKNLTDLANSNVSKLRGNSVFIDNNSKRIFLINPRIRFISMDEFPVKSACEFSAFLYGILSKDYDVENIYIDNLCSILQCKFNVSDLSEFLSDLNKLSNKYNVNVFINIHNDGERLPEVLKQYTA